MLKENFKIISSFDISQETSNNLCLIDPYILIYLIIIIFFILYIINYKTK